MCKSGGQMRISAAFIPESEFQLEKKKKVKKRTCFSIWGQMIPVVPVARVVNIGQRGGSFQSVLHMLRSVEWCYRTDEKSCLKSCWFIYFSAPTYMTCFFPFLLAPLPMALFITFGTFFFFLMYLEVQNKASKYSLRSQWRLDHY